MKMKIKIKFPDGSKKSYKKGISGLQVAESIGPGLAKAALAVEFNGEVQDLNSKLNKDGKLKILTFKDDAGKKAAWHSGEHVLTQAMMRLYPNKIQKLPKDCVVDRVRC